LNLLKEGLELPITKIAPPNISEPEVKQIALEFYDLKVTVRSLVGEIGQNFHLMADDGKEYVFKIANPAETLPMLEAQNQVLEHLAEFENSFQFPQTVDSLSGKQIIPIMLKDQYYYVRLLTFLPGTFLAEIRPHTTEMLFSLGQMLGGMDKVLYEFHHPAMDRYWHWDLKHALDLRHYLADISDARNRSLADYWLLQFETRILPRIPLLRKSVIHHDANDNNILVGQSGKVSGLIDFGDMVHSCTVFELAVALAYVMLDKEDPLAAAVPVVAGYHKINPLLEEELEVLLYLVLTRLTSSVIISAYQKNLRPDDPYLSITTEPAWGLMKKMVAINPVNVEHILRKVCGFPVTQPRGLSSENILKIRNKYIGKSLSVSYKKPLKITGGAMQYLFDDEGRTYLDCVNNVCHVGHSHPRVVRAGQSQMAILNTNTRYLHDHFVDYAQRLTSKMPKQLRVCFLVNSGSEANELALRLAQTYTGQKNCIVMDHAYHGNTSSVIEISPYKYDGPGGKGPAPHIQKVVMPDVYRGQYKKDDPKAAEKYAEYVQNAITQIKKKNQGLAAFFCESLPGVAGQIVFPKGYLKAAFRQIREAGGVCVVDEVQIGFGRVGTHFWGFQTQDVIPDIVTLGKPIGNGHPLGAVVTTSEIANAFDNGMEYFNTFGGNPVSCAVGLAVLDVIQDENLQENAQEVGKYFMAELIKLKSKYNLIGDVRGLGLFIGIELVLDRQTLEPAVKEAKVIVEKMKDRGVLLSIDGPLHNVLKIKPPMVFSRENVDLVVDHLDDVLREIEPLKDGLQ
jgi:4-aminobutyrate aminotransferase-like enzyme